MEDARNLIDAYVPTAFLWAAMVVIAGVLLSLGAAFAGGLMWALADSLGAIWIGAGALVFAIGVYVFLRLLDELQAQARHRRNIEQAEAEALLREREPQPFVVQDRPIIVNHPVIPEPPETINGIPAIAWEYFVGQLCRGVPISQNHWDRHQLPGGYEIASFDSYSHLVDPLVELGIIADRDGERRKSGRLTTTDPAAIMAALREWEHGRK